MAAETAKKVPAEPAKDRSFRVLGQPESAEKMFALVYNGPGQRALEERPKPVIQQATDAVVKISKTTICGTDLHILKGDVPTVAPGRILGHEGTGIIDSIGEGVSLVRPGDRVLISCITSDGRCEACRKGMYSHCTNGGWILGHKIDGTQAEYVRIPFADTSVHKLPEGINEEAAVLLSDILPTAYECGVLNGKVQLADTVAIVGAGPIGLAALLTAQFRSPSEVILIDVDDYRLMRAKEFGASTVINSRNESVIERVKELTQGKGVDVAIEAVGVPETFELCEDIVAPGGRIANIGVHGKPATLHLEKLWDRNISITTRLVDTEATPKLLRLMASGKLCADSLVTHRFALKDLMGAYDAFSKAATNRALKVVLSAG